MIMQRLSILILPLPSHPLFGGGETARPWRHPHPSAAGRGSMVKDYKKAQGPLTRTRPDNVIVINASSFTIENTISMKKAMTLALMFVTVILAHAQMGNQRLNPVTFTSQLKTDGSANAEIVFSGKIQAGWHIYSTNIPDGGPTSATRRRRTGRQADTARQGNLDTRPALRHAAALL